MNKQRKHLCAIKLFRALMHFESHSELKIDCIVATVELNLCQPVAMEIVVPFTAIYKAKAWLENRDKIPEHSISSAWFNMAFATNINGISVLCILFLSWTCIETAHICLSPCGKTFSWIMYGWKCWFCNNYKMWRNFTMAWWWNHFFAYEISLVFSADVSFFALMINTNRYLDFGWMK